ncbi:sugar ABC transporter permease [Streptomyces sp. KM273126]|nr:sugar ABC transporter permease [Streptomyces sp. KM273126]
MTMALQTRTATPGTPARHLGGPRPRWRRSETFAAWLFLVPSLIGFLVFTAGPVIAAGVISLLDWNLFSPPGFAGPDNFTRLGPDPTFWTAFGNTLYFTFVSVPLTLLVSLALALLLNQGLRRIAVFRSLLLLPYATITVAVAFVWIWLYIPTDGLVNAVLGVFGIDGPAWLISDDWAMPALIVMSVWKSFGFGMVIFLAGLQAIPQQLYEAARVDGATPWRTFLSVTLPLLSPSVFFVVVTSIIHSFQVFDQALVMTDGGPGARTTTLVMYIYQTGFQNYEQGYAAAQSIVLFAFIAVITAMQFLLQRRLVHYDV